MKTILNIVLFICLIGILIWIGVNQEQARADLRSIRQDISYIRDDISSIEWDIGYIESDVNSIEWQLSWE